MSQKKGVIKYQILEATVKISAQFVRIRFFSFKRSKVSDEP